MANDSSDERESNRVWAPTTIRLRSYCKQCSQGREKCFRNPVVRIDRLAHQVGVVPIDRKINSDCRQGEKLRPEGVMEVCLDKNREERPSYTAGDGGPDYVVKEPLH